MTKAERLTRPTESADRQQTGWRKVLRIKSPEEERQAFFLGKRSKNFFLD